jgi:hypothetical protein
MHHHSSESQVIYFCVIWEVLRILTLITSMQEGLELSTNKELHGCLARHKACPTTWPCGIFVLEHATCVMCVLR